VTLTWVLSLSIPLDVIATLGLLLSIKVFKALLSLLSMASRVNPVNCVKEEGLL
jgi:hypothetical protein